MNSKNVCDICDIPAFDNLCVQKSVENMSDHLCVQSDDIEFNPPIKVEMTPNITLFISRMTVDLTGV